MSETKLFETFPPASAKLWKQQIQFGLKGADYNETLVWDSPEGIQVKPFYDQDDLSKHKNPEKYQPQNWLIGQEIQGLPKKDVNSKIKNCLKHGAESLVLHLPSSESGIAEVFTGIDLKEVPVYLNMETFSHDEICETVDAVAGKANEIYLNLDPIGHFARHGNWRSGWAEDLNTVSEVAKDYGSQKLTGVVSIESSLYQNAGATIVQQLAYSMSHANEYLQHFDDLSMMNSKLPVFVFKVALGGNFFFEIAKLRALRWLWKSLSAAYGLRADCHILAYPSRRNKALYDYNTNLLRTTMECMSAVLGGANTVCNLPYDSLYHKHNDFSDRLARNQLLILKHESHLDKVQNPSDGCYYIETLTAQLAEKALEIFRSIEEGGGFLRQLKAHNIQRKIRESAQKEQKAFDAQERVLVGTNKYQNPTDSMKTELALDPFPGTDSRKTLIEPILERRLAADIDKKRLGDE